MNRIILLVIVILIALSNANAQEINREIVPGMFPAWDIQVICTAPEGCHPPYRVTAFLSGGPGRYWDTDSTGYVVANMNGMPMYDSHGNLLRYYITATPIGSEMPCGLTEAQYPTGSTYLEIEVRQGPCNMY